MHWSATGSLVYNSSHPVLGTSSSTSVVAQLLSSNAVVYLDVMRVGGVGASRHRQQRSEYPKCATDAASVPTIARSVMVRVPGIAIL